MVKKVKKAGIRKSTASKSRARKRVPAPALNMERATAVLQDVWGYDDFRKSQKPIIENVLAGNDVLGILPTGGGKSITFQVPALMFDGLTLVISPLIALMKDQVDALKSRGVEAAAINSHVDEMERKEIMDGCTWGDIKLLYVAPERLNSKHFMRWLSSINISLVAVDEAHCVTQWGHDFRPAYSNIRKIFDVAKDSRGKRPVCLALTATLPLDIEDSVAHGIGMNDEYFRIVGDPIRQNFTYNVERTDDVQGALGRCVSRWDLDNGRYIVYVGTVKMCEPTRRTLAGMLGVPESQVATYNGKMKTLERTTLQERFTTGDCPVVVATCAFGMGIDIPNIREIVHLGIKGSMEDYVQEAGRAGRDGLPATVTLIADSRSIGLQEFFIDTANPPFQAYEDLWRYLHRELRDTAEVMGKSARTMAKEMQSTLGTDWKDSHLYSALSIMAARTKGYTPLLERGSYATGLSVTFVPERLRRARNGKKGVMAFCIGYLNEVALTLPITTSIGEVEAVVDCAALAEDYGCNEATVKAAFRKLKRERVIGMDKPFSGKTTRILQYDAEIDEILPVDELERKRDRAFARLETMIEYMNIHTEDGRVEFIRRYFREGVDETLA